MKKPRYIVAQLGARMHYAVPDILYQANMIFRLYTDAYASPAWLIRLMKRLPDFQNWKKLLTRRSILIPDAFVTSFPVLGIHYAKALKNSTNGSDRYSTYIRAGIKFNEKIIANVANHDSNFSGIYAWNTAALELFQHYKGKKHLVLEQCIVPFRIEHQLLDQERNKNRMWEEQPPNDRIAKQYMEREEMELELADTIISPSSFVTESLLQVNRGWMSKIRQVPYGVRQAEVRFQQKKLNHPLHLLTVGKAGLRKGTPYIIEAASQLKGKAIFKIVGDVSDLTPALKHEANKHVELVGRVNRDLVATYYQWADIFLLPSICEGSATVTYEAMQFGLPMIVTTNTGSLIKDEYGGYIVRPGYSQDIVEAISKIETNPDIILKFQKDILEIKKQGTYESYQDRLTIMLNSL